MAAQLEKAGIPVEYETEVLRYIKPEKQAKYTCDFKLPNGIRVETKGRFTIEDRAKHLLIKEQHPDIDIRFVFSNSRTRISKASTTTYGAWCHKHGFTYADKTIPKEWLQ